MLVADLINRAYVLSGIVARGLDSVNAGQSTDGLNLLNLLTGEINIQPMYIPYYSILSLTTNPGQEVYYFANVASIDTITFNLNNIRYSLAPDNRRHYFGSPRAENISSLPFITYWERVLGGSNVYLYFFPSQNLTLKVKCKMFLPPVALDDELDDLYDISYQSYLLYLLVKKICQWNKISVNPQVDIELKRFQQIMQDMNPTDVTIYKSYSLSKGESLTYADVNFGRGWTTW